MPARCRTAGYRRRAACFALEHLADPALDVARLAAVAHHSRRTFDRRFRAATGCSALRWLLHQRVLRAQDILSTTDLDIDAVARASGFRDAVALRPHFRRLVGMPPQAYRASFDGRASLGDPTG